MGDVSEEHTASVLLCMSFALCLANLLSLKMEGVCTTETSMKFSLTPHRCILEEDSILHGEIPKLFVEGVQNRIVPMVGNFVVD
jgi:hypothetical protein